MKLMTLPPEQRLESPELLSLQGQRLQTLLREILPTNRFYQSKFTAAEIDATRITSPADLVRVPFTTKAELVADQEAHPPYGTVLTYSPDRYCRMHQTSGTTGRPLRWLDTRESWDWVLGCWERIYGIAGIGRKDRLFFAFSFGPFFGFWTAFEAAARLGSLCLPAGGMSSAARLRFLLDNRASVVLCTPTYALRLAEVAKEEKINLASSNVRAVIVAGEPGGSIPATRSRIESAWGARVFDHYGLTEVCPLGMECQENPAGLHILETECIAEVIDPGTGQAAGAGQVGELVLTGLGRLGSPLIRYRTGDLVRMDSKPCPCGRTWVRLEGGILGRTDDMIHLRGNNVYPTALEAVIRRFPEVVEYRVEVDQSRPLADLCIEVEPTASAPANDLADRISRAIRDELLFRAEVRTVPPGTLPRFEMKAKRIHLKGTKTTKESN
jgi:phenylacetate-CoA ligase